MNTFPRKVVAAANLIMFQDGTMEMLVGVRHWDPIMRNQYDFIKEYRKCRGDINHRVEEQQGFIDQWGKFMSREEAMQVVLTNGQDFDETRNGHQSIELFSEGVW